MRGTDAVVVVRSPPLRAQPTKTANIPVSDEVVEKDAPEDSIHVDVKVVRLMRGDVFPYAETFPVTVAAELLSLRRPCQRRVALLGRPVTPT